MPVLSQHSFELVIQPIFIITMKHSLFRTSFTH